MVKIKMMNFLLCSTIEGKYNCPFYWQGKKEGSLVLRWCTNPTLMTRVEVEKHISSLHRHNTVRSQINLRYRLVEINAQVKSVCDFDSSSAEPELLIIT